MFLRMLLRGALVRRGRALAALTAVVIAAAVTTAIMNLYLDVQAKLQREFRSYGANIVVVAHEGQSLPENAVAVAEQVLAGHGLAVPFAYAVARTTDGTSVVVAGTDLEKVQRLNRWWSVSTWPRAENEALVGARAAAVVSPHAQPFDLTLAGRTIHLVSAGTLRTGSAEDSRVYLSLADFTQWSGVPASSIEIAVTGSAAEITAAAGRLAQALPSAQVQPVRQIVEAEARVLGKTRASLYAAAALIIFTAMLCVLATLTGWVLDRRRDFAIMKAIGASERLITGFFAAEAATLGALGAITGFVVGIGVAAWIGRVNFHAAVVPRLSVLPVVFAGSVGVALFSALLPMALLRRVQPAIILRGE
jgi:putative ABC transport system permease protein